MGMPSTTTGKAPELVHTVVIGDRPFCAGLGDPGPRPRPSRDRIQHRISRHRKPWTSAHHGRASPKRPCAPRQLCFRNFFLHFVVTAHAITAAVPGHGHRRWSTRSTLPANAWLPSRELRVGAVDKQQAPHSRNTHPRHKSISVMNSTHPHRRQAGPASIQPNPPPAFPSKPNHQKDSPGDSSNAEKWFEASNNNVPDVTTALVDSKLGCVKNAPRVVGSQCFT